MVKKSIVLLLFLLSFGTLSAQSLWTAMPESGIPEVGERRIQPAKYTTFHLNLTALKPLLAAAPERFSPAAENGNLPILTLPTPNGGTARFELEETPVLHPDLQAKYPQIRSYTGRGIDDPTAVLKCDLTPWGFHGMVQSIHANTFYIDPAIHGNDALYVVYNKKDYLPKQADGLWACATPDPDGAQLLETQKILEAAQLADFQGDTKLRRYRLALACTGEYATFHGGTKPLVLAAMNTTMNRVNGVYERDFAVTMQIIANNDLIIYLNAGSDPYSNNDGGAMLGQNVSTCNSVIGVANYDIGHVFSTGGGGIAGLGVVCSTNKARGVTGGSAPIGDPFDIDYVAHEMGHQFSGNHTFGNCGGNVNNPAAVEPGSGTTIMAYAGICGPQNVANNSEDIFHGYNILEMGAFIYTGSGNNCALKINTTNHNPTVDAGPNRTIPKSTPFDLTAVGSDVDGDTLTYTWEQMDFGNAPSPPAPTATVGPLFRSYKGTTNPTRTFPRLPDLVNNINSTWEELPGVARNMTFRVVARDNDWYAGCTDEDDVQITVAGNSGPFRVLVPNTNVQWLVGDTETVTWDVANSTAAPVSCANVRITLSVDGGFTYPVVLADNVPNTGSFDIIVPANVSNNCRVRVESVGNIFFDISNTNFRIAIPATATFFLNTSVDELTVCAGDEGSFSADLASVLGFSSPITVNVVGAPAGATVTVSPNPANPPGVAMVTLSDVTPAMAGTYTLTVEAVSGIITRSSVVTLNLLPGAPAESVPLSPIGGSSGVSTIATLTWANVPFSSSYVVEVATNPSFSAGSIINTQNVVDTTAVLDGLQFGSVYYWRIRAINACGESAFSGTSAFQTGEKTCDQVFSSTDVPVLIPVANVVPPVTSNLTISENKIIDDVNVNVAFTHTYVGDLSGWLISPSGDSISLFDQPGSAVAQFGCPGDNGDLTFDSEAVLTAVDLENQCSGTPPALNGIFQPIAPLSVLNGKNAAGDWTFVIGDNYPEEDSGVITSWSLTFCFPENIAPGSLLQNNPLTVAFGQSEAILQTTLDMAISGIPAQGVFTLRSVPAHGTLSLNGTDLVLGDVFTQEDINNNVLIYTHNGDMVTNDEFLFDALDQNNQAWVHGAIFLINIDAPNLAATATTTAAVLCAGDANGQITVAATGLNGQYTYSLNGGADQNDPIFDGLVAGTYTVVITGQFGITVSSMPITLINPDPIVLSTDLIISDLTVTASGGTGVLEYSLDGINFQASNEFLNVADGIYTLTVQDENGCTATEEVIVAVNTLQATAAIETAIVCGGSNTGAITVTTLGGQAPYTYSLNGGTPQASNVFTGLAAGSYTVVITDDLGASTTTPSIDLTEPDPIIMSADALLDAITVTASGGTGTLEYSLDGMTFQGSNVFAGLGNGVYTVTVQDASGCTQTAEVTLIVDPLTAMLQPTSILCFGGMTALVVDAADGIAPYEYQLGSGTFQSSNTFNVVAGTYSVTVRDATGATVVLGPATIVQPNLLTVSVSVMGNDGSPIFNGGTPPYSFSTNAPNPDLQNLPNGNYSVTATDGNGCLATTQFTINVAPLGATATVANVACNGSSTGVVTLMGQGGIMPYQYSLNGSPFQMSNVFNNVAAGIFTATIRDADGTVFSTMVTVTAPPVLDVDVTVNNNSITAMATGGTPNYEYQLNGGTAQSNGLFTNLLTGVYTLLVTDANGCTVSETNIMVTSSTVEPSEAWGFSVTPNPSAGLFQLNMQNTPLALRAEVFDATGRLVRSLELPARSTTTLDLQDFAQGFYFLRLTDGQHWGGVRLSKVGQ